MASLLLTRSFDCRLLTALSVNPSAKEIAQSMCWESSGEQLETVTSSGAGYNFTRENHSTWLESRNASATIGIIESIDAESVFDTPKKKLNKSTICAEEHTTKLRQQN